MAQNERQGMEAAGRGGAGGGSSTGTSQTGSESPGASAPTRAAPAQGTEQASAETGAQGAVAGREQGQPTSRLSRREGWEDPITSFFGGSPFALFRRLSDDMDRLFFGGGQGLGFGGFGGRFLPHIDIDERDNKIIINADLPGCRPEDFHVDVEEDALVLQGERRSEHEDTRGGMRRSERTYGTFRRVIPLPPGAHAEAAEARFENGVLKIEIPFQQEQRSRRLEVRSGGTSGSTTDEPTRH